jgi:hypothetical protein
MTLSTGMLLTSLDAASTAFEASVSAPDAADGPPCLLLDTRLFRDSKSGRPHTEATFWMPLNMASPSHRSLPLNYSDSTKFELNSVKIYWISRVPK